MMVGRLSVQATVAALCGAALLGSGSARAAPNLIVNGNFDQYTINGAAGTASYQLSNQNNTSFTGAVLNGWGNQGYGFVFTPGSADTTGAYTPQFSGTTTVWGPGGGTGAANYSNNGYTATSPTGGNYVIEDGGYSPGVLYQTLTGLTVGSNYMLSFYWAAAQQYGFTGDTTEGWSVYWTDANYNVTSSFATPTDYTPSHGFTSWKQQTYLFTATATTDTLAFLASGTPSGAPPFSLLDGVSLVDAPEPSSWAMIVAGLVGFPFARRWARRWRVGGAAA